MQVTVAHMNDLVAAFRTYLEVDRRRSAGTVRKYTDVLEDFVLFCEQEHGKAAFDLEKMSKADLSRFLRGVTLPGTTSTWNARLAALRAFYEHLFKDERIAVNPAKRIDRQRTPVREVSPLSLDEFIQLVDAVEFEAEEFYRPRYVALLQVFFQCALRVNEVVALNVDQVDFDRLVLRDVRRKGNVVLSAAFNDVVATALHRHLRSRGRMGVSEEERALFVSDRGQRLSVRAVQEFVRRYAALAGIKRRVSPHTLRHTSATVLLTSGFSIRLIQERLGHAEVTTTQRYTHVAVDEHQAAAKALGSRFEKRRRELHDPPEVPMN